CRLCRVRREECRAEPRRRPMTAEAQVVDTAADAEFRARVRSFLETHAEPRRARGSGVEEEDDGDDGLFDEVDTEAEQRRIAQAQAFQAALFDAGLAGITWPTEYGGAGLGNRELEIFNE